MHTPTWTATSIKSHQSALKQRINKLIPLKDSVFKEAYARGLDFRTNAALAAAIKSTPELSVRAFSAPAFISRVQELADETTAEVVTEILGGFNLDISVTKRSEQRQGADRFTDVAYDVEVTLSGPPASDFDGDILFHLPEFGRKGFEPYRVDSANHLRATCDYRKTHFGAGATTIAAKIVKGRWHGGFYVYALQHQTDDTQCIKSLKAGLVRAILAQLPTRVRCSIFKPDDYQERAWHVEMRLPPAVQRFWNGSPFQFDIPQLDNRLFKMPAGFAADTYIGRFVDGYWKADLYSNGIEDARNPTTLAEVKHALLKCVNHVVVSAGYGDARELIPVLDDAGKTVGTVEFCNGQYEAWHRTRSVERAGNSHKFLGKFGSLEESTAAIRTLL